MKILIIDDSIDITDLLTKILGTIGHEVVSTDNGRDGLDMIVNQEFDVVFLDIAMPDFSGLDVIDELLNIGKINTSIIVLFTASSITDEEVNGLVKKGIHSCLRKPVRIEVLFEKINEISNQIEKSENSGRTTTTSSARTKTG